MADNLLQTNNQEGDSATKSEEVFPSVPPPPVSVKIRTMKSDLEQMARMGGGLPSFESVRAPRLGAVAGEEGKQEKKPDLFWIVVPIAAVALLGGIIYFVYASFFGGSGTAAPAPAGETSASTTPAAVAPAPNPVQEFVHQSLFRKPVDETLVFARRSRVESAAELETFGQRLLQVLSGAKAASKFIEIRFEDDSGRDLRADEALALPDALVLAPEFLTEKFSPDPTVFVYMGSSTSPAAGGSVPRLGYILALKPEENWLFLKDDVAKLESSPKIENFFLQSPGATAKKFEDALVSNQPARKLTFSSGLPAQAGAVFVYGWFKGNLILSSSEEGFKEALARL